MDTEITTTVEIADSTGHTTCQMTKSETLDKVSQSPGAWVFAGGQMVQSAAAPTAPRSLLLKDTLAPAALQSGHLGSRLLILG